MIRMTWMVANISHLLPPCPIASSYPFHPMYEDRHGVLATSSVIAVDVCRDGDDVLCAVATHSVGCRWPSSPPPPPLPQPPPQLEMREVPVQVRCTETRRPTRSRRCRVCSTCAAPECSPRYSTIPPCHARISSCSIWLKAMKLRQHFNSTLVPNK
jgi:hypothetical protein